jgi:hypothetical protein
MPHNLHDTFSELRVLERLGMLKHASSKYCTTATTASAVSVILQLPAHSSFNLISPQHDIPILIAYSPNTT